MVICSAGRAHLEALEISGAEGSFGLDQQAALLDASAGGDPKEIVQQRLVVNRHVAALA